MTRHHIRLLPAAHGRFDVTGAIIVQDTGTPIPDAARALIAAGASDLDMLHATCPDCTFVDMTLGRLTAPRPAPPKFNPNAQVWTSR